MEGLSQNATTVNLGGGGEVAQPVAQPVTQQPVQPQVVYVEQPVYQEQVVHEQ